MTCHLSHFADVFELALLLLKVFLLFGRQMVVDGEFVEGHRSNNGLIIGLHSSLLFSLNRIEFDTQIAAQSPMR